MNYLAIIVFLTLYYSFALMEINQVMAKMIFTYNWKVVKTSDNWIAESQCHVMWWKPALHIEFHERKLC